MLAAGVFGALTLMMCAESLTRAPASAVAPLDYTGLLWTLRVDRLIFAQFPRLFGIPGSVPITPAAIAVVLKPANKASVRPTRGM